MVSNHTCFECVKNLWYGLTRYFPWVALVILILIVLYSLYDLYLYIICKYRGEICCQNYRDDCIIIANCFLVLGAWLQLGQIQKTGRADFLLRMDDRYGSEIIAKARTVMHGIYLDYDRKALKQAKDKHLADEIVALYDNKNKKIDLIYILNFLEFLETAAYFANNDHVTLVEIDELLGGSLEYFYKILKPLISHLRAEYEDDNYFNQLEQLCSSLKNKRSR